MWGYLNIAGRTAETPRPVPCEKFIRTLRCTAIIVVEHATQDVSALDRTVPRGASHQRYGALLIDALMRPSTVVVLEICDEHTTEMSLAKDQDLVQALLSD